MIKPLIDIIIPAYNAQDYIVECIQSVFDQTISGWNIILVNDGSTDNTIEKVKSFPQEKISIINQENQGVSSARNRGLLSGHGKYVVFFDADDVMCSDFLEKRFSFLEKNTNCAYCCGDVFKFTSRKELVEVVFKGCAENLVEDILLYSPEHATVPSNYMLSREVLMNHKLLYNTLLSSIADKLFLLELNEFAKGSYFSGSPLYYRVREDSMSNKLTDSLIRDNELYYTILKINHFISKKLKRKALFYKYSILAFSYLKMKKKKGIQYLLVGFIKYPDKFILRMGKKMMFDTKKKRK